ncbi:Uncharacterised protein [Vibrio cholerae]|nr:Uncharacterised protein [Vibrio cholerae]
MRFSALRLIDGFDRFVQKSFPLTISHFESMTANG